MRTFENFRKVINADIYIICLPTPLKNLKPNLSYIDNFIKLISKEDLKGKLIILESTSYPSTTREKIEKKLSNKYLGVGKDYFVGYSPERISPGQKEKLEQAAKKREAKKLRRARRLAAKKEKASLLPAKAPKPKKRKKPKKPPLPVNPPEVLVRRKS